MAKKEKEINPLWGGRFKSGTDDLAQSFSTSIDIDKRLFEVDIQGSIAYAEILNVANLINSSELKKIKKGLNKILDEIKRDKFDWDSSLEDVHMNIEAKLVKIAGTAAKKIHTGRSRNDQVATDLRLFLKNQIDEILNLTILLQKSLLKKADENTDTLMPGLTHLQIAQPVTFGHHLMAWFEMLSRDYSRLEDAKKRMDVMPLGSAALSGTRFNIDRKFLAKKLGFGEISRNSMDAVSDRDFVLELASCLSIVGIHLSRICEEIIIWSSSQYSYIYLSDEVCTGSSIMPQKKNPDMAELIRGGASKTIANLMGLLSLMKNLPLTYNRDLQDDKEYIFTSIDFTKDSLKLLSLIVDGMQPNIEKMKSDCFTGQITATDLADYLVEKGIAFRKAHEIVGKIVAHAEKKKVQIFELEISDLKKFSKIINEDVANYLDPQKTILSRKQVGGTAPSQVKKEIKKAKKELTRKQS
ncbi:argininosuccinate lyase [SAR86 cluster bacterium]|nr:argininosuccinate lyase [SAR86 cluster bacterium]